jgi:drug/metabolite transporter (DMT)-like permease
MFYAPKKGSFLKLAAPAIPAFVVLALVAALSYSLRSIVTKASPAHLNLAVIMALQSVFLVPILGVIARKKKVCLAFPAKLSTMYSLRAFFGAMMGLVLYYTMRHMPASLASTLSYSSPLFTALLAPLFLGETVTGVSLLLTVLGFMGVALNALPYLQEVSLGFVGVGLLGGLCGSMLQIFMRKLAVTGEPALRGVFWMHAMTGGVAGAYCLATGQWHVSAHDLLVTFILAALTCGGQLGTSMAYQHGKALTVNALSFVTLPLTVFLASVVLNEHISTLALVGIALTLPACFGLVWVEQSRVKAKHHQGNHKLTVDDVREEHATIQNALGAQMEPLFTTDPTEDELKEEDQPQGLRLVPGQTTSITLSEESPRKRTTATA